MCDIKGGKLLLSKDATKKKQQPRPMCWAHLGGEVVSTYIFPLAAIVSLWLDFHWLNEMSYDICINWDEPWIANYRQRGRG